ncbi:MAG: hypothetical protein Q4E50_06465 [Tissierellia bacterium]|nr:hypothetical protein [Tissierellia bacterium]
MKCYNCGDDADMKVYVIVNGKLQQVDICSKCYKEQMEAMVEHFRDQDGDFNPEEMQKHMYKILMDNKEEFEKIFGSMLNDQNFNLDNIDINDIGFDIKEGMANFDISEVERFLKNNVKKEEDLRYEGQKDSKDDFKQMDFKESKNQKEIKMLKNSVDKKKQQLNSYVRAEDYMAAATLRDQIRDINKRIMFIMELEKEYER